MHAMARVLRSFLLAALLGLAASAASGAGKLGSYNVELRETSVSGISSGAAMAVQLDVAFSSFVKGVGVVAGPPYYCARGSRDIALTACMAASLPIDVDDLVRRTRDKAQAGEIDAVTNLSAHRVWLFSGGRDSTLRASVVDDLETYYRAFVDHANVVHRRRADAEHAMPTLSFGNACAVNDDPFINDCNYDAAGNLLEWIYGGLQPKSAPPLAGEVLAFDQSEFVASPAAHGMGNVGYVYVPEQCRALQPCRLHVALHGCRQFADHRYLVDGNLVTFGTTFVEHAGYNEWADANGIVVLYPQAQRSSIWLGIFGRNPNGCWDWWGYDDAGYATRTGSQVAAIKRMIDRITKAP